MSVALVLRKTLNGDEIDVPIASEETFVQFWLPVAKKKSLTSIIYMHWGYFISHKDLADIVRELKTMKDAFLTEDELDDEHKDFFKKRIESILEKIEPELVNPNIEGFVG